MQRGVRSVQDCNSFSSYLGPVDLVVVGQEPLDEAVHGGQGLFWVQTEEGHGRGHVDDALADRGVIL